LCLAELFGIGETIANLANETVAQGEISRVVDMGLDNPELFQNLVHFYGRFFGKLDQALVKNT
jgi:hypothetical protein